MHNNLIFPPSNWQDFERLCHLLWMDLLKDPNIQMHGRQGQPQCGVDVYGTNFDTQEFTCIQPNRVACLSNHIINSQGIGLGNIRSSASIGTPSLITIAITLHNSGPDFQSIGLDLFERLLDLDVYQIHEALQNIDSIPEVMML